MMEVPKLLLLLALQTMDQQNGYTPCTALKNTLIQAVNLKLL